MSVQPNYDPSAYCCTITPFKEDGALDVEAVKLLIGRLGAGGVGAFIGTSSPGEGFSLSLAETELFYGTAKEAMAGRKQCRAMGVEPHSADESWELIKIAQSVGLDAMQLYSLDLSHGNQPMMPELERFFRTNLERMTIPAVISSHIFLGYAVPIDMMERLLADYPHLIGFNITNMNIAYVRQVVELCRGRAEVHVGGPQQALTVLAMGGQGFLCTEAILAPNLVGSVPVKWAAGDERGAADAYTKIIGISAVNRWSAGSIRFTKAALRALGLPGGYPRPPYLALDDTSIDEIRKGLSDLGVPDLDALLSGGAA